MEAYCGVVSRGAAVYGGAQAAASRPTPAPRMPVAATGLPPPLRDTEEDFFRGGTAGFIIRSQVEQGILVDEMVDPIASTIQGHLFSGPPPERPQNPMIHDPLFGKTLPSVATVSVTTRCPTSIWTMACNPCYFCGAPSVVLVQGLSCHT